MSQSFHTETEHWYGANIQYTSASFVLLVNWDFPIIRRGLMGLICPGPR